jgi:hypothetical protein
MQRAEQSDIRGGLVLILVGVAFLAANLIPALVAYVPLLIGLGLLLLFAIRRSYGLLVPAGIVTGVGLGIFLATRLAEPSAGAAFLWSLGGGFLAIWLLGLLFRLPENHWWPLIPGGILILVGGAAAESTLARDSLVLLGNWWPLILVAVGLMILVQHYRGEDNNPAE